MFSARDFVYVCEEEDEKSNIKYKLVFKDNTKNEDKYFLSCSDSIKLDEKPGGISIRIDNVSRDYEFETLDFSKKLVITPNKYKIITLLSSSGTIYEYTSLFQ